MKLRYFMLLFQIETLRYVSNKIELLGCKETQMNQKFAKVKHIGTKTKLQNKAKRNT